MSRANYVGAPQFYNLNEACRTVAGAFGHTLYLVGSSITRRDFRDVDIRCILADEDYDALFGKEQNPSLNPLLSLLNVAISGWLAARCGLPVDFQFQRRTEANAEYPEAYTRHAVGIFFDSPLHERRGAP